MKKRVLLVSLLAFNNLAFAKYCEPSLSYSQKKKEIIDAGIKETITDDSRVNIKSDKLMIITHPTLEFDILGLTRDGLSNLVMQSELEDIPRVHIYSSMKKEALEKYFFPRCESKLDVVSTSGAFNFNFQATHIITAGGFLSACQRRSLESIFENWNRMVKTSSNRPDLRLDLPIDAIYVNSIYKAFDENMSDEYKGLPRPPFFHDSKIHSEEVTKSMSDMLVTLSSAGQMSFRTALKNYLYLNQEKTDGEFEEYFLKKFVDYFTKPIFIVAEKKEKFQLPENYNVILRMNFSQSIPMAFSQRRVDFYKAVTLVNAGENNPTLTINISTNNIVRQ